MPRRTASDVLREAADIIERDGWAVGNLRLDSGERCVLGAIYKAVSIEEEFGSKAEGAVYLQQVPRKSPKYRLGLASIRLLCKKAGIYVSCASNPESDVYRWNDDSNAAEVVATLRAAAE